MPNTQKRRCGCVTLKAAQVRLLRDAAQALTLMQNLIKEGLYN